MVNQNKGKYFIKIKSNDEWNDMSTLYDGVVVLSISGFNEKGEIKNAYCEQWINSSKEDFMITTKDDEGNDVVVRDNQDLTMTFIAGTRYSTNKNVDTQTAYDNFVDYITKNGSFYIRSMYANKEANVVCLKGVKTTAERLHRGTNSFILATATLHILRPPETSFEVPDHPRPELDCLLLEDSGNILL